MRLKLTISMTAAGLLMGSILSAGDKGNPVNGKNIYDKKCSMCHEVQMNGVKRLKLGPTITNPFFLATADDSFIRNTITKGRMGTAMPPMPMGVKTEEIDDIIAYLRSLPVSESSKKMTANIKTDNKKKYSGDSADGKLQYERHCSYCHGEKGNGITGAGPGIGRVGFLSVASDDFIFQTVKHGRPGTAMRAFNASLGLANMSDKDIKNVIAYLKSVNKSYEVLY